MIPPRWLPIATALAVGLVVGGWLSAFPHAAAWRGPTALVLVVVVGRWIAYGWAKAAYEWYWKHEGD